MPDPGCPRSAFSLVIESHHDSVHCTYTLPVLLVCHFLVHSTSTISHYAWPKNPPYQLLSFVPLET
jgi:hypothetical protein